MLFYLKKKFNKFFPPIFIFGEIIVLSIVYFTASFLVSDFASLNINNLYDFSLSMILWTPFSYINGNYKIGRTTKYIEILVKTMSTLVRFLFIVFIMMLLIRQNEIKREFMIYWVVLFSFTLTFYNLAVHAVLKKYRAFDGNIIKANKGYIQERKKTIIKLENTMSNPLFKTVL